MRTFKSKPFARWARKEGLNDASLLDAVDEMEERNIDANLGGQVYKKRVALAGRGKRGGVRTLIAYQDGEKAFFMFGFGKSDAKLKKALKAKELIEVK